MAAEVTNGVPGSDLKAGEKSAANQARGGKQKIEGELDPWPDFIQHRLKLWEQFKKEREEALAKMQPQPLKVTLPDGSVKEGQSWRTSPIDIAQQISQGLADQAVVSRVNGVVWDLDRPLEGDCKLEILKFDDPDGQYVYWHSTAHILGEAMEQYFGGLLCYGPPIKEGFYYDMYMPKDRHVVPEDFKRLQDLMQRAIKEKQPFERLELTKEQLHQMFNYNQFKGRILNEKVDTPTTTVYRCGPLIDLCLGPHVRHTGKIKAFQVTKASATYWEGKADAESLQRVYGISFPDPKQLKEYQKFQEEAAARDHRKIGVEQELFCFNERSPGSCFFYPKGAYIYNTLVEFIRKQYRKRGFQEVISPNIYSSKLWETSGHWQHYAQNMFIFDIEKEKFGLKPMNCPGHCLMFKQRARSWKELPLRFADFGVLHRNELSGALSGLTRVRRFQQDDAHIFVAMDQVKGEIGGCLDFLDFVYRQVFGFDFKLFLSTRPDEYMGELAQWNFAEDQLKSGLEASGFKYQLNPGDGAFYGPKIDIIIQDAMRREHQCATIQLDFQLPQRFELEYKDAANQAQRPVMIHRAVLGSLERFIAILVENFAGKWPFWLSPRQAMVIPVHAAMNEYAEDVMKQIFDAGFECESDLDPTVSLNKKVRNAQLAHFNFILIVGEQEMQHKTVNVRTRENQVLNEKSISDLLARFRYLKENYVKNSEEPF